MSSPEYAEERGVSGAPVVPRASLVQDPAKRSLLWFLQAQSLQEGGLRRVAAELQTMFPDRCTGAATRSRWDRREPVALHDFLTDLCINPRLQLEVEPAASKMECFLTRREFPDLKGWELQPARTQVFRDVVGALLEYKERCERQVQESFARTANGTVIWEVLDEVQKKRCIGLVNGREGRGKTEAIKAYFLSHMGQCRLFSPMAFATKTTLFRGLARTLGLACGPTRKAAEMQGICEDFLIKSKLMLIIDEAHWFFDQAPQVRSTPELVDWIGTLSNHGVRVCLITTPRFFVCMERARQEVGWNHLQFRRRVKVYRELSDTSVADLQLVARSLMPGAQASAIRLAASYPKDGGQDLSSLGDVCGGARRVAESRGHQAVQYEDVETAIDEILAPSDKSFKKALDGAAAELTKGKRKRKLSLTIATEEPATFPELPSDEEVCDFPGRAIRPAAAGAIKESI
jgi:hypothetical protein